MTSPAPDSLPEPLRISSEDVYTTETATVYRSCGQRYFSRTAAIKRYARVQFFRKHPCECEQEDYSSGYPGVYCGHHEAFQRVMPRYIRLIRKALRSRAAIAKAEGR